MQCQLQDCVTLQLAAVGKRWSSPSFWQQTDGRKVDTPAAASQTSNGAGKACNCFARTLESGACCCLALQCHDMTVRSAKFVSTPRKKWRLSFAGHQQRLFLKQTENICFNAACEPEPLVRNNFHAQFWLQIGYSSCHSHACTSSVN